MDGTVLGLLMVCLTIGWYAREILRTGQRGIDVLDRHLTVLEQHLTLLEHHLDGLSQTCTDLHYNVSTVMDDVQAIREHLSA
jgi:hypothetical protein